MTTTNRLTKILQAAREYRTFVRAQAKLSGSTCPIRVVDGDQAPTVRGGEWHYETRGGTYIAHPSAYSKRGWSNMVYCASTRRVQVGRGWLAQRQIPEWCMYPVETGEELIQLGAVGPAGQSAVAIGTTPERALDTLPLVGGWMPPAVRNSAQDSREAA